MQAAMVPTITDVKSTPKRNVTSQQGSGTSPGPHTPGRSGVGGGKRYFLSAKTCLDLLPHLNEKQINTEIAILEALDVKVHDNLKGLKTTRSTLNSVTERKRDLLRIALSKTITSEVDKIVDKYDSLAQSFHRSLEDAKKKLEITTQQLQSFMVGHQQADSAVSNTTGPAHHVGNIATGQPSEEPVSFLPISFSDLTYDNVADNFTFNQTLPGHRACAYFGDIGYSYGSISHNPSHYPPVNENPVLDRIFDEISQIDPTFTRQNFSCLATLYKDGNSSIAMHSDDERVIAPGSNIYTVSFGSERTARYYNVVGALQTVHRKLDHGAVNVMTQSSQSVWKHGIIPDPNVTSSRISLTFRHMIDTPPADPTQKHTVPHIAQPVRPTRILLLTDSIHSSTPEHIFETIPDHVCIKKREYQLANIDSSKHEFAYTDLVILSMGVNALCRYNHTGESLFRTVAPMLKHYRRQFPHCKFMFNSVLLTRDYKWLNNEIEFFNSCMYDLSRHHSNLSFFDSDRFARRVCEQTPGIDAYAQGPKSGQSENGIHISLHMRRVISSEMVKSVGFLSRVGGPRFRRSDWLRNAS